MNQTDFNDQEITELRAARIYIRHQKKPDGIKNFAIGPLDGFVDVEYSQEKLKFQVVSIDGGPNKLISKGNYQYSFKLPDIFRIFVEEPITKKAKKYGGSGVSDVILLIHTINKPGTGRMLENEIERMRTKVEELGNLSGFKAIYLVFDMKDTCIEVYTKN